MQRTFKYAMFKISFLLLIKDLNNDISKQQERHKGVLKSHIKHTEQQRILTGWAWQTRATSSHEAPYSIANTASL